MATTAPASTKLRLARRWPDGSSGAVELQVLAREAGLHPELVRRLVRLGLLEPVGSRRGTPLFPRDAAARLALAVRLRRDLGLNYAGAVLACDLLARIDRLEAQLRRYEPRAR
jgi:DNA-binding transcriptional MerR regulator